MFCPNLYKSFFFFFDGYFISSKLYLFQNILIFDTLSGCDSISLWFNTTVAAYWKHVSSSFFWIYCGFLLFYPVWRINIWTTTFEIYLAVFVIQTYTESNRKPLSLIDVSKPVWYLERLDSKSSSTTSLA